MQSRIDGTIDVWRAVPVELSFYFLWLKILTALESVHNLGSKWPPCCGTRSGTHGGKASFVVAVKERKQLLVGGKDNPGVGKPLQEHHNVKRIGAYSGATVQLGSRELASAAKVVFDITTVLLLSGLLCSECSWTGSSTPEVVSHARVVIASPSLLQ